MSKALDLYRQGFAQFAEGKLDEAITLYREAVALDEDLAIAWNGLSIALAQSGLLEDAIEAARALLALEPDDPLSHTNLSRVLQQKGLIAEAEDAKAEAMRLQMLAQRT